MLKQAMRRFMDDWLIPPAVARLLVQRTYIKQGAGHIPGESAVLARNAKFHNMYAGRRCFVIGNGPSLNKQDLAPLANEITLTMNRFNRHPIIDKWQPTIFCMADPGEALKAIGLRPFVDKVDALAYFFRTDVKEILDRDKLVAPERVFYLRMTGYFLSGRALNKRGFDITKTVPPVQNTSLMAIMLALYMGCSPIYLLGMDHDWLAKHSLDAHFYPDSDQDPTSTSTAYWSQYRVLMEMALTVWRTHEILKDFANQRGIQIYNATSGGHLDVYPRAEFQSLFPSSHA